LPAPPQRIASLTLSADEVLPHIAEPARIRALTWFVDDPTISTCAGFAPAAARVRGLDPERIIALEPDLVFVAHYSLESAVRILGSAGIPVVRLREVHSFADIGENVRVAAAALGEVPRGEKLVAEMKDRISVLERRTAGRPRPRVLYFSGGGYTAFAGTIVSEKITLAGGRNAAEELGLRGMKSAAIDVLVGLDADVIIVPQWSADDKEPVRQVTESPAFRSSRAVQTNRVHALPARDLTSESPDSVTGVELLARLLHPEAFSS
jgi:iron complex transport system substrate-binding protein